MNDGSWGSLLGLGGVTWESCTWPRLLGAATIVFAVANLKALPFMWHVSFTPFAAIHQNELSSVCVREREKEREIRIDRTNGFVGTCFWITLQAPRRKPLPPHLGRHSWRRSHFRARHHHHLQSSPRLRLQRPQVQQHLLRRPRRESHATHRRPLQGRHLAPTCKQDAASKC
jgi:hypothetical protein